MDFFSVVGPALKRALMLMMMAVSFRVSVVSMGLVR
jgi:hypothetical protein